MTKKKKDGLQRLLDFLNFLQDEEIHFVISSKSRTSITVDFGGPGIRFEVDFYPEKMIFAHFTGDEAVYEDDNLFDKLLKDSRDISGKRPPSNA